MSSQSIPEVKDNDRALKTLGRAIALSRGRFSLILVRCNYGHLQGQILPQLHERCAVQIRELVLSNSTKTLYHTIRAEVEKDSPQALMVLGLETVDAVGDLLTSTNRVRDEFRKQFAFPIVLWVNDAVLQQIVRLVPDFNSWSGPPIKFAPHRDELVSFLRQGADELFERILNGDAGQVQPHAAIAFVMESRRCVELESALKELQNQGWEIEPYISASLQFVKGVDDYARGNLDAALDQYRESLGFWQEGDANTSKQKAAVVRFYTGLCDRSKAQGDREGNQQHWQRAADSFRQAVAELEREGRLDLVAEWIRYVGEALRHLENWDELEALAEKALSLHRGEGGQEAHPDRSVNLARDYGFLAEVALHRFNGTQANQLAQRALDTLAGASVRVLPDRGLYLLLLGRSLRSLEQNSEAIATLEGAKQLGDDVPLHRYNPELYIEILAELRELYFEAKDYLTAFRLKQEQREIESQYGLRAFIGAGRLQPKQQAFSLVETGFLRSDRSSPEMADDIVAASGRQEDVKRLIGRMGTPACKLTVIHGQSGVGKSSIVQAGLVPALQLTSFEARDALPVLVQVYTDWEREFSRHLADAIDRIERLAGWRVETWGDRNPQTFLEQLRQNAARNLLTVLIFDQFEEFFFVYKDPNSRRSFYQFLSDALKIPYVKVILSLREDYLHYLLECSRLTNLAIIDDDILHKNILYYLGNFSHPDAKAVIQSLTARSPFRLESVLVDALVEDLAAELGEVRPIELQVVGAQLQTEKITKLEQYRELGSTAKETLVERFLEEVITDCGPQNQQIAKLILYLLTDENNTRPLKTRADLELELDVKDETLNLVLQILVESRLVFQIPAFPADRYQLVHDYLVPFVRQQQSARLIAELEKEREQRKLTEAKLNKALKQQLRTARQAALTLAAFLVAIGGVATVATLIGINTYLTSLSASSKQNSQLDRVVSAIEAGKQLNRLKLGAFPGTRLQVVAELSDAIKSVKEHARLEGHQGDVTFVTFSDDGTMLATASEDKTVKVWRIDGTEPEKTLPHSDNVTTVSFSRDGQRIATGSLDKIARIWSIDGSLIKELKGHTGSVTSVSFSHDSQRIVTANEDKTVRLWSIDGSLIKELKGHEGSAIGVSFSPDGQMLASADNRDRVKLWSIVDGREIRTIENYGTLRLHFSPDNQTIILTNKDSSVKIYDLDGNLVKTTSGIGFGSKPQLASLSLDGKLWAFVDPFSENSVGLYVDGIGSLSQFAEHNESITHLSFSPDRSLLATASKDDTVKLWSLESVPHLIQQDSNRVTKVRFSLDGNTMATVRADGSVKLLHHNGMERVIPGDGSILSFSPDGKTLATGSAKDVLNLWSLDRGEIVLPGSTSHLTSIRFSPDGQMVAAIHDRKEIKLWKRDGTAIATFAQHTQEVKEVIFSPDSQIIASIGDDNAVKLWKRDGTAIATLPQHNQEVKQVIFSPDSQIIASIGDDNMVKLWNRDGTEIEPLTGHPDPIQRVIFSEDNKVIVSLSSNYLYGRTGNSTIKLWRRDGTRVELKATIDNYGIDTIAFSPNHKMIASTHFDNTVKLWSLEGRLLQTLKGHYDRITDLRFSPDGETIATASQDNTIRLWKSRDGQLINTLWEHNAPVESVRFSPDGNTIASSSEDKTVKLWTREGKLLNTLPSHDYEVNSDSSLSSDLSFSGDGKIVTSMSSLFDDQKNRRHYTIKVWSIDGTERKTITGRSKARWMSDSLSLSGDRTTIAFATQEDAVKLWSLDGRLQQTLEGHGDWINSVSFSHDGETMVSASDDKTLKLWSTRNGEILDTIDAHDDKINGVNFSPDGKFIVSGSDDRIVKVWNRDGSLHWSSDIQTDPVTSVSVTPNGKLIASLSGSTIKLWHSNDGAEKQSFKSDYSFENISFSTDGNILAGENGRGASKLYLLNGIWLKETSLYAIDSVSAPSFSDSGNTIQLINHEGAIFLNQNLDDLLKQNCDWALNYLKNNPNVEPGKNSLCDNIKTVNEP